MPCKDRPTVSTLVLLERDGPLQEGGRRTTQTHDLNSPMSWNRTTHSLEAAVIFTSGWVKAEQKTRSRRSFWLLRASGEHRRQKLPSGHASLVETHHCLLLLHPQGYRQFSLFCRTLRHCLLLSCCHPQQISFLTTALKTLTTRVLLHFSRSCPGSGLIWSDWHF